MLAAPVNPGEPMNARTLAMVVCFFLWSVSQFAVADVYRCVEPKTKAVTYSGTRCTASDAGKVSITAKAIMEGPMLRHEQAARPGDIGADGRENNGPRSAPVSDAGNVNAEQRDRLASECSRGFARSCSLLRTLNGREGDGAPLQTAASSAQRDKLTSECERGFAKSCTALRALNGEKMKKVVICSTAGSVAYGSFSGTSICR